jgi:hypothetical protein
MPYEKLSVGLEDVLDISIATAGKNKARYIRLKLGARSTGNPLTLAECEVWGK